MRKHSGHRATIAQILGVSERHVYRMLKKYGAP
jgi:DNA-binding NtrC family response regulator